MPNFSPEIFRRCARAVSALVFLAFCAPAVAAPPVCPTPSQGYEIAGCFVDGSGDEFSAGGTVDVYDLAFDQSLTDTFAMGTFVVDAFTVAPPSTPPASCGTCGPVDFCVVATFNAVPAGIPDPQTFCADGNLTVNDGGFDLRGLTGGNPSVVMVPVPTYSVGGMVSDLAGTGLVLQNNGGDDLAISANGAFQFSQPLADGSTYNVTVNAQPGGPAQECTVTNGAGTLAGADVTSVSVSCETLNADLAIAKSDGGVANVAPGATLNYTLTVTNNGPLDSTGGTVTDVLPAGLTFISSASGCAEAAGTVTCAFGAIPAAGSTVMDFVAEVDAAQATDISNTATVSGNEPDDVVGNNSSTVVTALDVPVPTVAMSFTPDTITEGESSTLVISIDNSAATTAADNIAVTNNLPAGMVLADPANAATTCTGGTLTAAAGSAVLDYSGGSVAAGASCAIQADVTSDVIGAALNTSEDVTSSLGNSGPASATLTVEALPVVRDYSAPLPSGDMGSLTFTTSDPNCTLLADPVFQDVASVSPAPPADLVFLDGVVSFVIARCQPGATVAVTLDYGKPVDPQHEFWKAGDPWYPLSSTVLGTAISFDITDGGLGDEDGTADGTITDPGGAAFQVFVAPPPPPPPAPAIPVPTLNFLALLALVMTMFVAGLASLAQRHH